MKFLRLSGYSLLSVILLTACGEADTNENNDSQVTQNEVEEAKVEPVTKSDIVEQKDENEVKEGPLTKVGQWIKESDGTKVTLKKMANLNKTLDLEPVLLTLHEVKVLERVGGSDDGNIIQVSYTTENTSEGNVMFHPIKVITTNTKHQIDVTLEDTSMNTGSGDFYGEVKKDGFILVSYPDDSLVDLTSLKIITGDVWNSDYPEKYFESVTEDVILD